MLEPQPKYIKAPGYRLNASTQDKNFIKRQNKFHKSKTLKDEMPDALYNSNSIVKQSEKLSNVRRSKKRMTQLEKNIDLPDTLLGFNEYKENKIHKDTRVRKMLRSESLHPDLPDILEPINEIITSTMPKPYVIKEESKNQEISENDYNKEQFIKGLKKKFSSFKEVFIVDIFVCLRFSETFLLGSFCNKFSFFISFIVVKVLL